MPTKDELKLLQALPLEIKVLKTKQRIREWVNYYGESGVYVSFSGGKDSTVLLHLVREEFPNIEAVFVNTGLEYPEIHPTQKPINVLKQLIEIFTDEGDVVIDPCAGSGTTLRASYELGRNSYGFEIDRKFYTEAKEKMLTITEDTQMNLK